MFDPLVSEMIRPAVFDDIPAIIALCKSEPGFWNDHWNESTVRRALSMAGGLAYVWVGEDQPDSPILGFVCAHDLGFRAYLNELIVSKDLRGQHVGQALLSAVEDELHRRGCEVLIADVWQDAVGFYEAQGWSPPPVVLLRKRLE